MQNDEMLRVVGVDGCRGGWVAVEFDSKSSMLVPRFHSTFREILDRYSEAQAICIDVPIGLTEADYRACDKEARVELQERKSSVFPAPDPRLLHVGDFSYYEANNFSKTVTEKGLSQQLYAFIPKVAEVNYLMTSALQNRVFEVHPEVCFWALNSGRPMAHSKKVPEGYEERRNLLADEFGPTIWTREQASRLLKSAGPDDILDATVAAWTACRVVEGNAGRLPAIPEKDARGLRMEMVF